MGITHKMVEASTPWLTMERQLALALWNRCVLAVGSKNETQLSLLTALIKSRIYPHKEKRKSSIDSIKNFQWRCSWKGGQLPRPCGITATLSGSFSPAVVFGSVGSPRPASSEQSLLVEKWWHSSKALGVFWLPIEEVTFALGFYTLTPLPCLTFGTFLKIGPPSQSIHVTCVTLSLHEQKSCPEFVCRPDILYFIRLLVVL